MEKENNILQIGILDIHYYFQGLMKMAKEMEKEKNITLMEK